MPTPYFSDKESVPSKTLVAAYLDAKGVYSFGEVESAQTITLNSIVQNVFVYILGLLLVVLLAIGGSFVLSLDSSSIKDSEWATAILSAISGVFIGYALGRLR